MTMIRLVLLILAILAAVIAVCMNFGMLGFTEGDPHSIGWIGVSLGFGWASFLPFGGAVVGRRTVTTTT